MKEETAERFTWKARDLQPVRSMSLTLSWERLEQPVDDGPPPVTSKAPSGMATAKVTACPGNSGQAPARRSRPVQGHEEHAESDTGGQTLPHT